MDASLLAVSVRSPAMVRLGIEHPFIQGPFGGGLSSTALVAAVSNRGSLGSYGMQPVEPEEILGIARDIRAATRGPFALNLWVSDADPGGLDYTAADVQRARALFEPFFSELGADVPEPESTREVGPRFADQVQAVLEAEPPVFSFVFGVPEASILAACKKRGIATIGAATTVVEARALDDAGIDLIVATGSEAGGHRVAFLRPAEESLMGTFGLVQLVAPRVRAPVIAAGGIVDGRGIRAALALGAQIAQIGTAFLACEESNASPEHRRMLFGERAFDTTLTRAFSGRLARGIVNRFTQQSQGQPHAPYPLQLFYTRALKAAAMAQGGEATKELVSLWCSQAAPNLRYRNAPALIDALIAEVH